MHLAAFCLLLTHAGPTEFAGPAVGLVELLRQPGGPELIIDDEIALEPVLLSSPSPVEPAEVKRLLAEVFEGEWVEIAPGKEFFRIRAEAREAQTAADQRERRDGVARWLPKLVTPDGADAIFRHTLQEIESFERRHGNGEFETDGVFTYKPATPGQVVLRAMAKRLGADALTDFEMQEVVAWSTRPVAGQRAFPAEVQSICADYQNVMERLSASLTPMQDDSLKRFLWKGVFDNLDGDFSGLTFVLSMTPAVWNRWSYYLRVYAADGSLVESVWEVFNVDEVPAEREPVAWAEHLPIEVTLKPENARLYAQYLRGRNASRVGEPVAQNNAAATPLTDPVYDPISLGLFELTEAAAKMLGRPVIAVYGDDAARWVRTGVVADDKLNARQLWQNLWTGNQVQFTLEDDALIIRPHNPVEARRTRVERDALRAYVSEAIEIGGLTARGEALFHFHGGPGSSVSGLSGLWSYTLNGLGVADAAVRFFYFDGALLGSLSDEQWDSLVAGGVLPGVQMSREQQRLLRGFLGTTPPEEMRLGREASGIRSLGDFRLALALVDDPTFTCVEPGGGDFGSFPPVPLQLSYLSGWFASLENRGSDIFTGRYSIHSADSVRYAVWQGTEKWIEAETGPFVSQRPARLEKVRYLDLPEEIRRRIEGGALLR